jgi:hypothetical protein
MPEKARGDFERANYLIRKLIQISVDRDKIVGFHVEG